MNVPADGTIINGASEIDESLVTGETLIARARRRHDLCRQHQCVRALTVRVTAVGASTLVEEVERLLDKATRRARRRCSLRIMRGSTRRLSTPPRR